MFFCGQMSTEIPSRWAESAIRMDLGGVTTTEANQSQYEEQFLQVCPKIGAKKMPIRLKNTAISHQHWTAFPIEKKAAAVAPTPKWPSNRKTMRGNGCRGTYVDQ